MTSKPISTNTRVQIEQGYDEWLRNHNITYGSHRFDGCKGVVTEQTHLLNSKHYTVRVDAGFIPVPPVFLKEEI